MASLDWYQKKYGKRLGRKKYNGYHLAYRMTRRKQLQAYFKAYRARKSALQLSTGQPLQ
jgi:hypothetical protein